ncbi:MAG: hypothetical protein EXS25_08375 [Pedosphaera sp.]|nr:hypothetical protein [Pedosphaera sp.]
MNATGFERPSARTLSGDVDFSMRFEVSMENVFGDGGIYARDGKQWGSWNAVYGPRSANGQAVLLWDAKSGKIDRSVVEFWKRYDLRLLLAENWPTIGPKLRGKIHLWVGEADQYFLNNAVHLLDDFLWAAELPSEAEILFGPGKGHGWNPEGLIDRLRAMQTQLEAGRPHSASAARDSYLRGRFLHASGCPHCKGGL